MNVAPCRSCRQSVTWVKTAKSGSPMPLDRDDERGNVVLDEQGRAVVFRNHAAAEAAMDELASIPIGSTWISHHAEGQCPQGREWEGKKRSDPDAPQAPAKPEQGTLL